MIRIWKKSFFSCRTLNYLFNNIHWSGSHVIESFLTFIPFFYSSSFLSSPPPPSSIHTSAELPLPPVNTFSLLHLFIRKNPECTAGVLQRVPATFPASLCLPAGHISLLPVCQTAQQEAYFKSTRCLAWWVTCGLCLTDLAIKFEL